MLEKVWPWSRFAKQEEIINWLKVKVDENERKIAKLRRELIQDSNDASR